jgi:hypothetical protein
LNERVESRKGEGRRKKKNPRQFGYYYSFRGDETDWCLAVDTFMAIFPLSVLDHNH